MAALDDGAVSNSAPALKISHSADDTSVPPVIEPLSALVRALCAILTSLCGLIKEKEFGPGTEPGSQPTRALIFDCTLFVNQVERLSYPEHLSRLSSLLQTLEGRLSLFIGSVATHDHPFVLQVRGAFGLTEQIVALLNTCGVAPVDEGRASVPVAQLDTDEQDESKSFCTSYPLPSGNVLIIKTSGTIDKSLLTPLHDEGLQSRYSANGSDAVTLCSTVSFNLVIIDLAALDYCGFGLLLDLKDCKQLRNIPIVICSDKLDLAGIDCLIRAGADDIWFYSREHIEIQARLRILLAKRARQEEVARHLHNLEENVDTLEQEKSRNEMLLANVLPRTVVGGLQEGHLDPAYYEDATIVITDFVAFGKLTEKLSAQELVSILGSFYSAFDVILDFYGLEKVKTMGDSYMFVGGIPKRTRSHPIDAILAAGDMLETVADLAPADTSWKMRVGVHTGPVMAGVLGVRKFSFDVWGDTVNIASRLEQNSSPNRINISTQTYSRVKDFFDCQERGAVLTKTNEEVVMYFVNQLLYTASDTPGEWPPAGFLSRYENYFNKTPGCANIGDGGIPHNKQWVPASCFRPSELDAFPETTSFVTQEAVKAVSREGASDAIQLLSESVNLNKDRLN